MNKKRKLELNASLDKALEPPNKKKRQNLDSLLEQYQDDTSSLRQTPTNTPSSSPFSSPPNTSTSSPSKQLFESPAPAKDFHKVANSINRDGLPQGLFERPSMKIVYDVLYQLTRGAIVPSRTTRISKDQLQKKCGLGSRVTLDSAVVDLAAVGLIRVQVVGGKQGGNIYETLLPEELPRGSSTTTSSGLRDASTGTRESSPRQNLEPLAPLENTSSSTRSEVINIGASDITKTSYKTKDQNVDDERKAPLGIFIDKLDQVFREINGKGIDISDAENFGALADLIAEELRAARLNTRSISKPSAFLVQHLKARLTTPARLLKTDKIKPDLVGKTSNEDRVHVDLSGYSPEEIEELRKEFCLDCGRLHEDCKCSNLDASATSQQKL